MIRDGIDGNGRQWDNVIRGDIMFKINPYRPGEGLLPTYLAGRDEDIYRRLLMSVLDSFHIQSTAHQ